MWGNRSSNGFRFSLWIYTFILLPVKWKTPVFYVKGDSQIYQNIATKVGIFAYIKVFYYFIWNYEDLKLSFPND